MFHLINLFNCILLCMATAAAQSPIFENNFSWLELNLEFNANTFGCVRLPITEPNQIFFLHQNQIFFCFPLKPFIWSRFVFISSRSHFKRNKNKKTISGSSAKLNVFSLHSMQSKILNYLPSTEEHTLLYIIYFNIWQSYRGVIRFIIIIMLFYLKSPFTET